MKIPQLTSYLVMKDFKHSFQYYKQVKKKSALNTSIQNYTEVLAKEVRQ